MYFFRCCNQNYPCRQNRPSVCKTAQARPELKKEPEPAMVFRTVSAGGITLTGFADTEHEYDLILLSPDISSQKHRTIVLSFACNVTLLHAVADIHFQLLKSVGNGMYPLSSSAVYRHTLEFSGSDAISFTVYDAAPAQQDLQHYLIRMTISGRVPVEGMAAVTNPVLTAVLYQ